MKVSKKQQTVVLHNVHTTPFEHIADREALEEARLSEAIERLQLEHVVLEKELEGAEKRAEEKMREEIENRLLQCKEEMDQEATANEAIVKEDMKAIEASFKKHMPTLVKQQIKAFLPFGL